jgi:hypothetical protein
MKNVKLAVTIIFLLSIADAAMARLRETPEIASVVIDQRNPDTIYIRIINSPHKAARSTDAGKTFEVINEEEIPNNVLTTMSVGNRRYALNDSWILLRSDDGGTNWTCTSSSEFLGQLKYEEYEREKKSFHDEYEARMPQRSSLWHVAFGLFAVAYFLITYMSLRYQGWLQATITGVQGLFMLLLVWSLLWVFHTLILMIIGNQLDNFRWSTELYRPSAKLGIALAIAAYPLPLLVYLFVLWLILPGSYSIISGSPGSQSITRRRISLALLSFACVLFIGFPVWVMFVGVLWE